LIKKIKNKLKMLLREWLGIKWNEEQIFKTNRLFAMQIAELTALAADINIYSESKIIIISRIGSGRVKIINVKFSGLRELEEFMKYCEIKYGAKRDIIDAPRHHPDFRY